MILCRYGHQCAVVKCKNFHQSQFSSKWNVFKEWFSFDLWVNYCMLYNSSNCGRYKIVKYQIDLLTVVLKIMFSHLFKLWSLKHMVDKISNSFIKIICQTIKIFSYEIHCIVYALNIKSVFEFWKMTLLQKSQSLKVLYFFPKQAIHAVLLWLNDTHKIYTPIS